MTSIPRRLMETLWLANPALQSAERIGRYAPSRVRR